MNRVNRQNPDNPAGGEDARPTLSIPSAGEESGVQIATLLSVVQTLLPFTLKANESLAEHHGLGRVAMDGSVICAAESTMIAVLDRVEQLVKDDTRWTFKQAREAAESLQKYLKAQTAVQEISHRFMESSMRPSARLRPGVGQAPNGKWVAMMPGPSGTIPLMGVGDSPEEALAAFDRKVAERMQPGPGQLKIQPAEEPLSGGPSPEQQAKAPRKRKKRA
jgi:hypothetical protein